MIMNEPLPPLRWRASSPGHILGHARLADFDAELEQLTMDSRRPPQRIGDAHLADQPANFQRHHRSTAAAARLPAPIRSEPGTMPTDDSLRLHNRQCVESAWHQTLQPNEDQTIDDTKGQSLRQMPSLDVKLMRKVRISASSEARDRNNKTSTDQTKLQASLIRQKHRAIRPHVPAGLGFR